jgi:hypothetical protein
VLLIALGLHTCSSLCTPIELSFQPPFIVTGLANKTTFFVQDSAQQNFVLKYHPRGIKRAIRDALCAWVGKTADIAINEVEIFAQNHPFNEAFSSINPLEQSKNGVTTLHVHVPGIEVKSIKNMHDTIAIKRGLCKEKHLNSLVKYPQLCDIVAFDIFVDNSDRHNRNLFFDEDTEQFYAIDMDHGLNSASRLTITACAYDFDTIATLAYYFVKTTLKKRRLSQEEIGVLTQIRFTLQQLAYLNPPEIIFDEWMATATKAGFVFPQRDRDKIKKYLEYHTHEIERLIALLYTI